VLICHRGALLDRQGLSAWMASFSDLSGIVELSETHGRTLQRIRAQVRRSGVWRLLDVFALRVYYRMAYAAADRRFEQDTVEALVQRFGPAPAVPVLRAGSVNAPETIEFLESCRPDFVIARCKTLLKPAVFQVPPQGTYVLHPGVCPEYRNAHGCFWALSSGDLDRVGLTLLRIDAGVDTGPVYGYFTYPFDERRESHVRIQQRVLTENLDAIRNRLLEAVAGRADRIDTSGRPSAVWGQPWLTAFARWKWAARRRTGGAHAGVALP
jgi:folate-dependent phosphoribosylglycinamide formyltransferase PurN